MAIKKVALRKIEDGIPNTALREIKALREIEDSPYVSSPIFLFDTVVFTYGVGCVLVAFPFLHSYTFNSWGMMEEIVM